MIPRIVAIFRFSLFIFLVSVCLQSGALASVVKTSNTSTLVSMYGFLDYANGWSTKTEPSFYQSNTTFKFKDSRNKTLFASRAQVRLGFKFKSADTNTFGNVMTDSWPGDFTLELAYVTHKIGKHIFVTIGKDWSLVNQRLFHFSSFTFKPYAAGFQGSKRITQIQTTYTGSFKGMDLKLSVAFEDRNTENGVIIGENISPNGEKIASSGISSIRKNMPAVVGNAVLVFKTGFGKPSKLMAYYETMPLYLECKDKEHRENAYLYSIASRINIGKLSLIGQYIHTLGMSGIAGIKGNSLKTFSYIYDNGEIIKRTSDTFGGEVYIKCLKSLGINVGYVYLKFKNKDTNSDYFLKNEVKSVSTAYVAGVVNVTKVTKLFVEWDRIKTRYAAENTYGGNFEKAFGNQLFVGYRMYF